MPAAIDRTFEVDDGRLVVVERATGVEARRLARAAEVLARVRHPGLTELVAPPARDGDAIVVRTWFAGTDAATSPPRHGDRIAVATASARALAHLHASGFHHGAVAAHHLVVDDACRPVWTGLDPQPAPDRTADVAVDPRQRADVAAFATIVRDWCADSRDPQERRIHSLAETWRVDPPDAGTVVAALEAVAASSSTAAARPNGARPARARRLARVPSRHRVAAIAAATVSLTVAAWLLAPEASPPDPAHPAATRDPTGSARPVAAGDAIAAEPCPVVPVADGWPADQVVTADLDGDGCDEPVRLAGEVLEVGDTRFAAGLPGDIALVGDWDCDGVATPGAYRPSSGEVFLFDRWATSTDPVRATALRVTAPPTPAPGCGPPVGTDRTPVPTTPPTPP